MNELVKKKCTPLQEGTPPFTKEEVESYLSKIKGWHVYENHHIKKLFPFPDFRSALSFINKIGELAEQENHHPNICFTWGRVEVIIWTHEINGLHENDFILASKTDELFK